MNKLFITLYLVISSTFVMAQIGRQRSENVLRGSSDELSYLNPKEYTIAATTVSGVQFLDKDVLVQISKLTPGNRITVPGEATSNAIKNLWEQGLFDDVQLNITSIKEDSIYFDIAVVERPRLTRIDLKGLRKGEADEIRTKLNDKTGKIVNENLLNTTTNIIKKFFNDKGFLFTEVNIKQRKDTTEANNTILEVTVDKNSKVKVNKITFEGNDKFSDAQLRKYLKKTKQRAFYKVFGSGKFLQDKYEEDKDNLIAKMQGKGYRDASILSDSKSIVSLYTRV